LPHVAAWHRRLAERPAYRAHVMVPFEALRGRLDY
jgi:glutathione S-transferase